MNRVLIPHTAEAVISTVLSIYTVYKHHEMQNFAKLKDCKSKPVNKKWTTLSKTHFNI